MYGILVLCFGKNQNHMSPGCNYGGVYCLMYGILVLCLGYLSYVWDICLMYVLGTKYLVPSTWYQVLGTKYLVPSTRYQVPSTLRLKLKALGLRP